MCFLIPFEKSEVLLNFFLCFKMQYKMFSDKYRHSRFRGLGFKTLSYLIFLRNIFQTQTQICVQSRCYGLCGFRQFLNYEFL